MFVRLSASLSIAFLYSLSASAQGMADCASFLSEKLVDSSSSEVIRSMAKADHENICRENSNRYSRGKKRRSGGGLSYGGIGLDFSSGGSSQVFRAAIDKMCSTTSNKFAESVSARAENRTASNVSSVVSRCLAITDKSDFATGTFFESVPGTYVVELKVRSKETFSFTLEPPDVADCTNANKRTKVRSQITLTCKVKPDLIADEPQVRFVLSELDDNGQIRVVPHELTVKGRFTSSKHRQVLEGRIRKEVEDRIAKVPPGAVLPFNLKECPEGYREYEQAYGRFVRGIDPREPGKSDDPENKRAPGHHQGDTVGEHKHHYFDVFDDPKKKKGNSGSNSLENNLQHTDNQRISLGVVGSPQETRPKNVALLFCERL